VFVVLPALGLVAFPPGFHLGLFTFPPAFSHSRPPTPTGILPGGEPPDPPRRLAEPRRGRASGSRQTNWTHLVATALLVAVFGVWIARFEGAFGGPVPVRSAWSVTR
jgi:hypothetical protein